MLKQAEAGDGRQEHRMHETWPEKYVQDLHRKGGSHNIQETYDNEVGSLLPANLH